MARPFQHPVLSWKQATSALWRSLLGATVAAAFAVAPAAHAGSNPFEVRGDHAPLLLADGGKCGDAMKEDKEGKCGEGKCGDAMKEDKEGKCGDSMKEKKEAKCGDSMKEKKEAKCGEGKCGGK